MILKSLIASLLLTVAAVPQVSTFTIMGSVRDDSGRGVGSTRVSLLDESNQQLRAGFTDSSGRIQFKGIVSGRYVLRVEQTGPYEAQSAQFELQALRVRRGGDEPYPVEIVLRRKKESPNIERSGVVFAQTVPDAARAEYQRGADSIKDNKQEAGISALKKAIEIFPDYFLALELLGTEYVKHGEFAPAIPVLNHALEVNQSAPKSLYALGVAHLQLKQPAEAVDPLRKAAEMDPNNVNGLMMLGIALGNIGNLAEAETALKKAYELGKDQVADVHLYLAGIYNKREMYNDAIRELELYLKEAKDLKDRAPIRAMIDKLREKQKAKKT